MFPSHALSRNGKLALLACCCLLTFHAASTGRLHAQTASQVYAEGVEAYNRGDVEGAKRKFGLALEVDRNFRPASAMLTRIAAEKRQAGGPGLSTKTLEKTVLPVEFNDTTLSSALEFIRQKVAEDSGNKLRINFAINLPPELANKKFSLKLERVPVPEMLRYIGELTGVKFEKQTYAILVTPAGGGQMPAAAAAPSP